MFLSFFFLNITYNRQNKGIRKFVDFSKSFEKQVEHIKTHKEFNPFDPMILSNKNSIKFFNC